MTNIRAICSWRLRYTPTKMVRRALTRPSRVRPLFEKISDLIDTNSVFQWFPRHSRSSPVRTWLCIFPEGLMNTIEHRLTKAGDIRPQRGRSRVEIRWNVVCRAFVGIRHKSVWWRIVRRGAQPRRPVQHVLRRGCGLQYRSR
jgi:hypothetical protein